MDGQRGSGVSRAMIVMLAAVAVWSAGADQARAQTPEPATTCVDGTDGAAPNDGKVRGLTVRATVVGGLKGFPMADEGEFHCVPTSIARAIAYLNLVPPRHDDPRRVAETDKLEEEVVLALAALQLWLPGGGTRVDAGVAEFATAKKRVLDKLKITHIETEAISNPKLDKAFFDMLATQLKAGCVIEAHISGAQSSNGKPVTHMANIGRIVSLGPDYGIQTIDDPTQGEGGAGLDWRAPRLWKRDGTSYGLSMTLKEPSGAPKRIPGYQLHGVLIECKKR